MRNRFEIFCELCANSLIFSSSPDNECTDYYTRYGETVKISGISRECLQTRCSYATRRGSQFRNLDDGVTGLCVYECKCIHRSRSARKRTTCTQRSKTLLLRTLRESPRLCRAHNPHNIATIKRVSLCARELPGHKRAAAAQARSIRDDESFSCVCPPPLSLSLSLRVRRKEVSLDQFVKHKWIIKKTPVLKYDRTTRKHETPHYESS